MQKTKISAPEREEQNSKLKTQNLKFKFDVVTFFKVGMKITPLLPLWVGNGIADLIGDLAFWLMKSKRKTVICNLSRVLNERSPKEIRHVARHVFRNNVRNYYDIMRVHALTIQQVNEQVEILGMEHVREAQSRGKGVIAFAAHMGSFSFATQMASSVDLDFHLVVEPIKPPELFELIKKQRETDSRSYIIPVGGVEVRNILRALKRNECVCLAIDRDVIGTGQPMTFFGAETKIPLGVAELALKTGATCLLVHSYRRPDGKQIVQFMSGFVLEPTGNTPAQKEADIKNGTARMLREVEKIIRATPDQWVVLQPIWPDCSQK